MEDRGTPEGQPADIDKLLHIVGQQSQLLQSLLEEVANTRSTIPPLDDRSQAPPHLISDAYRSVWQSQILKFNVNDDTNGLLKNFVWRKGHSLNELLLPTRPWNRWQYRLSYPRLSAFLQDAAQDEASRSQVICEDLNEYGKVSRWESKHGILDQQSLWQSISTRTEHRKSNASMVTANGKNEPDELWAALSRNMRVLDLSPMVAAIVLGATPRINLSSTAPFLERYLSFCNWGKATLFGMKILSKTPTYNAYVFEYHFAFYFVPKGAMDPDLAVKDFRNLRRSSAFGPNLGERSQWIYEEQLSFLLMGQGSDVHTTYQLAERYFRGPYIQGTGQGSLFINPDKNGSTPSTMFLNWILLALHHVRFRWQSAVEAVDNQIVSASDIIFSDDDPDLLSDDPQFSRSKTYFWALQAYKMFDERLEQTINTWTEFRKDGLVKLNDGRMSDATWEFTVASIDLGIDRLKVKLAHIRNKSQEVQNLRAGLFGASALFDSRTTVRQGDNIRLLTYITLLFLPLSFGTSIFGMQVVLPALPIKVFIITLPTIFVFTAVLVFNLQNLIDMWETMTSKFTTSLRRSMKETQTGNWKATAKALQYDKVTHQPPTKRHNRESTHWSYVVYGMEGIVVHLPVHEVNWLFSGLRTLHKSQIRPDVATKELSKIEIGDATDVSRAARVRAVKVAQIKNIEREKNILLNLLKTILSIIRATLLPISLTIVSLEYLFLVFFSIRHPSRPFQWLGLRLASSPPVTNPALNAELTAQQQTKARKMTIVSIAGSENIFNPVHPSRRRWRKVANTQGSGLNDDMASVAGPSFRDVFNTSA